MDVRFGIKVFSDNGHHVTFRMFAATGGQHLGGCGQRAVTRPKLIEGGDRD